jgi:hypothetical protein
MPKKLLLPTTPEQEQIPQQPIPPTSNGTAPIVRLTLSLYKEAYMYKLELLDGTIIDNLTRLNPSTFSKPSDSSDIYYKLTDDNLSCATLYKDDEIEDILIDYSRQNFFWENGIISFRIRKKEEAEL